MNRTDSKKLLRLAFWVCVFTWCMVFFYRIKPLIPYDLDDWTYIAHRRLAVPVWRLWNPSKVLPELLLPFCSEVGVHLIMPFLKDYLHSLSFSYALFTGAFICVYLILMERMLREMFKLSRFQAYLLSVFYLVLHFWLLRTSEDRNNHMLFAKNLNCFFNYVIPNVLNASLVLYFFCNDPEEIDSYRICEIDARGEVVSVSDGTNNIPLDSNNKFIMPKSNVTVIMHCRGSGVAVWIFPINPL